jgi:hypothetical protein
MSGPLVDRDRVYQGRLNRYNHWARSKTCLQQASPLWTLAYLDQLESLMLEWEAGCDVQPGGPVETLNKEWRAEFRAEFADLTEYLAAEREGFRPDHDGENWKG